MNEIWITSDSHFHHQNIIKYQPKERPFDSVEEMNEALIERWNEVVKPNDEIWHLGDFAFANKSKVLKILSRLNGKKYFIFGNHDGVMRSKEVQEHFEWMGDYRRTKMFGRHVVMFHYPIHSWNMMAHGSIHFYGHTHCSIPFLYHGRARDIGVDGNNLYPHNVRTLIEQFDKFAEIEENEHIDPRGRSR